MVNIKLDSTYLLLSDPKQWILARSSGGRIINISYHPRIEGAVEAYFRLKMRLSNATSVNSLLLYVKSVVTSLNKALQPLEIKIETPKDSSGGEK